MVTSDSGSMSIVQFHLPTNQTAMVQSVIQPNHQSVIQQTNPISAIQLPKNVILVNKIAPGSVIQSTETEPMIKEDTEQQSVQIYEDESKRRREILARRPSYRKILSDLSATEATSAAATTATTRVVTATNTIESTTAQKNGNNKVEANNELRESQNSAQQQSAQQQQQLQQQQQQQQQQSSSSTPVSSVSISSGGTVAPPSVLPTQPSQSQTSTISIPSSYIKMLPSIQINPQDGSTTTIQGIPTIMTNSNTGSSTIVQYATSSHDGQFIVPAYQLRPTNHPAIAQNVVMATATPNIPTPNVDEAVKKREMRLLKNREAAKECRRKKKEYIKCLENRVAVLENQNKALIEELKTLKELYCKKSD
ncbi:Cyclic AMP-responsive element-binding protein 1 [Sarcoptes scabiei]|nr:Cyclic AMP-responsive element-binding protein 1 [Sarcoptes scabiei]UXI21188.1 MFS-type transporter [Sarcoptes scabiei]